MKRSRGRNRRPGGNQQNAFNNPNRHFESVGPDVKIRGSAQQVLEKYLQYGRDAYTSGDRILSEAYFQYAEHYQRIVAKQTEARGAQQQGQNPNQNQNRNGNGNGPRDDRGPGSGQERDSRSSNDDNNTPDESRDEAEVVPTVTARRNEDEESDSLRVIDSDDDRGEAQASETSAPESRSERAPRKPRKPYRAKEDRPAREPVEAAETDGVMKTLARGRRKPAPEEDASVDND
jgi:hypothetical protein